DGGLVGEHAAHVGRRDVALDDIAADLGGVAGAERLRYAGLALDLPHLGGGDFPDLEAVLAHVLGPFAATAAVGILVHDDLVFGGHGGGDATKGGQAEQRAGDQRAQGLALRLGGDVHGADSGADLHDRNCALPCRAWPKLTG